MQTDPTVPLLWLFKPIIDVGTIFDRLTFKGMVCEHVLSERGVTVSVVTSNTSQRLNKQGLKRL